MTDRIWVRFKSPEDMREAFVRDISRGRMLLRVEPRWRVGERLLVGLRFPDDSTVEVVSEVVHVTARDLSQDRAGSVGVRFVDLDESKRDRIERFLADAVAGRDGVRVAPADYEVRPTREVALSEIARRVQSRLQALEDVVALPELATSEIEGEMVSGTWDDDDELGIEADFGVRDEEEMGPSTKEVPVFDPDLLLGVQDELALVSRGRETGSAYDVLGANPEASVDALVGLFSSRTAALQDDRLGQLPDTFQERISGALQELRDAIALLSDPEKRAALDVKIGVLWPPSRSGQEREALRGELMAVRNASDEERQQDWAKAEPFIEEARMMFDSGDLEAADRAARMALLYDPYQVEYLELQAEIQAQKSSGNA